MELEYQDSWGGRAPGIQIGQTVALGRIELPCARSIAWAYDGPADLALTITWGVGRTSYTKTLKTLKFSSGILSAQFLQLKVTNTSGVAIPAAVAVQGWTTPAEATPTVITSDPRSTTIAAGGGVIAETWRNLAVVYNSGATDINVTLARGGAVAFVLHAGASLQLPNYIGPIIITGVGGAVVTEA